MTEQRIRINRMKRRRQVRHQMTFLMITACIVIVLVITLSSGILKAKASGAEAFSYKYFTSVCIQPGDSLYSLSQQYTDEHYASIDAYMREVIHMNALEDTNIHTGQYLILPYYSQEFVQ